jgi:serine/threonine protein kinase
VPAGYSGASALATQIDLPLFAGTRGPAAASEPRCGRLPLQVRLGSGALGVTWRSRLPDGTPVAVKRLASRGRDLRRRLEQLPRVDPGAQGLLRVLSGFEDDGHLWAVWTLDDGVPLSRLLEGRRLRPVQAVAIGMGLLNALAGLHQAGVWHGAVHGGNVHLGGDGAVRLGDYGLVPDPPRESSAALRAADVNAAGALVAAALGWSPQAEGGRRRARLPDSSLGLAVRAITGSRRLLPAGHEAALASLTLWEGARGMATSRRQARAREQLAALVAEVR